MKTEQNKNVADLKKEFAEYVKNFNPYEWDLNKIFQEWVFEKLAEMKVRS